MPDPKPKATETPRSAECPTCGGATEDGFILDYAMEATRRSATWVKGRLPRSA